MSDKFLGIERETERIHLEKENSLKKDNRLRELIALRGRKTEDGLISFDIYSTVDSNSLSDRNGIECVYCKMKTAVRTVRILRISLFYYEYIEPAMEPLMHIIRTV